MLKQQGVEIQLSQQRLFHLTVCPCVNGNVNSALCLKGRDGLEKTARGHVYTASIGRVHEYKLSRTHT